MIKENIRASKDELTLTDAICSNDDIANGLTTEIKNEIAAPTGA